MAPESLPVPTSSSSPAATAAAGSGPEHGANLRPTRESPAHMFVIQGECAACSPASCCTRMHLLRSSRSCAARGPVSTAVLPGTSQLVPNPSSVVEQVRPRDKPLFEVSPFSLVLPVSKALEVPHCCVSLAAQRQSHFVG
ncbi:unnamed protein product [Gadus morhua 'NCC']